MLYISTRKLITKLAQQALCEKCPNTDFFLIRIFPYSEWVGRFKEQIFTQWRKFISTNYVQTNLNFYQIALTKFWEQDYEQTPRNPNGFEWYWWLHNHKITWLLENTVSPRQQERLLPSLIAGRLRGSSW